MKPGQARSDWVRPGQAVCLADPHHSGAAQCRGQTVADGRAHWVSRISSSGRHGADRCLTCAGLCSGGVLPAQSYKRTRSMSHEVRLRTVLSTLIPTTWPCNILVGIIPSLAAAMSASAPFLRSPHAPSHGTLMPFVARFPQDVSVFTLTFSPFPSDRSRLHGVSDSVVSPDRHPGVPAVSCSVQYLHWRCRGGSC